MQWETLAEDLTRGGESWMSIERIVNNLPTLPPRRRNAKFINFIYEATGVPKSELLIDMDLRSFQDHRDKIQRSIDDLASKRSDSKSYPILNIIFFARFNQFIRAFVIKSGALFFAPENEPGNLVDFIQLLLKSECMPFRHTATLTCLKIITAGAEIATDILKNIESAQAEEALEGNSDNLAFTVQSLKTALRNVQSIIQELCMWVSQRFKDSSYVIRELCLTEAERWCKGMLNVVGLNVFSKSLANRLVDQRQSVRQQALQVALILFRHLDQNNESINISIGKLFHVIHAQLRHNINTRFGYDALVAMRVFIEGLRSFPNVLPTEFVKDLLLLVYSEDAGLAVEAGALLKVVIEAQAELAIDRLRELIKFLAEKIGWETCVFGALKYSPCGWLFNSAHLMRALLQDDDQPLSMNEGHSLIVLLGCLVKTLATEEAVPRQRVHEKHALRNLLPLPRPGQSLRRLPPVYLEQFPYILTLCSWRDAEAYTYLVRLLQYMTYDVTSDEQFVLRTWLRKAFNESKDRDLAEEISRALATLVQHGTVKNFAETIKEISQNCVSEAQILLVEVYSEGLHDEDQLKRLWCVLMKISALLAHGHLDDIGCETFIPDTWDVLRALDSNTDATTPIRVQLLETCLLIVLRYLCRMYKSIPSDSWGSITPLHSECSEIQKNANSCIMIGSSLVLRKEAAVRFRIYPIMCDFLVEVVRLDFKYPTVKNFIMASKLVLETDVFQLDNDGNFPPHLFEPGFGILLKFSRLVQSGAMSVADLPPIFHHYSKFCDSYDEVLRTLLLSRGSDYEPNVVLAVVRSVRESYMKDGIGPSQVVVRKLATLFGEPKERESSRIFHEALVMTCWSLNPSGWDDDTTTFAYYTALNFNVFLRNLSSEQLSGHLDTKIPDFQVVTGNIDMRKFVENYLQLIERVREALNVSRRTESSVSTSRQVPEQSRQAKVSNRRSRRSGTQDESGDDWEAQNFTRRSYAGSGNRRRARNRMSTDEGSESDVQEQSSPHQSNGLRRYRRPGGNRTATDEDSGSDRQEQSPPRQSNVLRRNRRPGGNRTATDEDSGSDRQDQRPPGQSNVSPRNPHRNRMSVDEGS